MPKLYKYAESKEGKKNGNSRKYIQGANFISQWSKNHISGSEAFRYAIQGNIIIGLLYLVSNINSSEPPLYLDFLHCINGIQHGCDNSVLHQGNCTWMWAVGGTRAKVNS